jgi:hypothetical protein
VGTGVAVGAGAAHATSASAITQIKIIFVFIFSSECTANLREAFAVLKNQNPTRDNTSRVRQLKKQCLHQYRGNAILGYACKSRKWIPFRLKPGNSQAASAPENDPRSKFF